MTNVAFRTSHSNDSQALTALAHRAKARWGYPSDWIEAWTEDLTITPDYIDSHHVIVAELDSNIVGMAALETSNLSAEIAHVWIDPDHHGQGIGRALVRRALETARSSGYLIVEVLSDPNAEDFYRRLGAVRIAEEPASMPGDESRTLPRLEFRLEPNGY